MNEMAEKIWEQLSKEISEVVARAGKSVVAIDARSGHTSSGIVWKRDLVLTAAHAIRHETNIHVIFAPGRSLPGRLAGLDRGSDIALIKLEQEIELDPAPFADAASLSVGEFVVAVARTRRGNIVASSGILSGLMGEWHAARTRIDQFIRPDLTMYSGFSGGGLLNSAGSVLGMNTSGLLRGKPLTLPSSTVTRIAEEIASKGHVARPYIGVVMQPVQVPGLLVMHVEPGGPAAAAGVLLGDLILGADGTTFDDLDDLQKVLLRKGVGQSFQASIIRGGQKMELAIRIGERPSR
jgi:S1-C subfamily serine protease